MHVFSQATLDIHVFSDANHHQKGRGPQTTVDSHAVLLKQYRIRARFSERIHHQNGGASQATLNIHGLFYTCVFHQTTFVLHMFFQILIITIKIELLKQNGHTCVLIKCPKGHAPQTILDMHVLFSDTNHHQQGRAPG